MTSTFYVIAISNLDAITKIRMGEFNFDKQFVVDDLKRILAKKNPGVKSCLKVFEITLKELEESTECPTSKNTTK